MTSKINRVINRANLLSMANMSAKFDEEAQKGLDSIMFKEKKEEIWLNPMTNPLYQQKIEN